MSDHQLGDVGGGDLGDGTPTPDERAMLGGLSDVGRTPPPYTAAAAELVGRAEDARETRDARDARDAREAREARDTRAAHDADASFEREALPWLPDVARFARSLARNDADADDLTQETFLRAYQAWHTFQPGSDCRRWLFTICRHAFLRTRQRDRIYVDVGETDGEADTLAVIHMHNELREAGLGDLFTRLDVGPALERALEALPDAYRGVAQLVDVEGLTYEEAAEVLDVPVGTVRSRLFRARRLLQQALMVYAQDAGLVRREGPSSGGRG